MNLWIAMFLEISSPWGCTQQTEGLPGRLQALAPVPGFHSGSSSTHQFISTATGSEGAIADAIWRESTCWGVSMAIETNTQQSTSIHWENAELQHRNVTKGTPTPCPQWQEVWLRLSTSLHHWDRGTTPLSPGATRQPGQRKRKRAARSVPSHSSPLSNPGTAKNLKERRTRD